jgi:hypothetical protein
MTPSDIPAALLALEQRDPVATIPLRSTLKRLHVGGLLPSTRKALMEFAAKDVVRLAASSRGEG